MRDEGHELLARAVVGEEDAREGRRGGGRLLLLDAAHAHAHVAGFDDHGHAHGLERFLDAVADLHRQPLLHLQAPGETLDYAGDLRESGDAPVGDVGHVGLAVERQHVVLAERVELDVLDQHHLLVLLAEHGRADDFERVFVVALGEERHRLGHPFGRLQKPLARRVLAQQTQDLAIMVFERFDGRRVETFFFFVVFRLHRTAKIGYFSMECK